MLDAWWKALSGRLEAGPSALQRLPPVVAHVAEALWLQALDEARARVALEQKRERTQLEQEKLGIEVKSSVLTLREAELEERIRSRERTIETLEVQVRALTRLLAKAEARRDVLEGRARKVEHEKGGTAKKASRRSTLAVRPKAPTRQRKSGSSRMQTKRRR